MENNKVVPQKLKFIFLHNPAMLFLDIHSKGIKSGSQRLTYSPVSITALFTVAGGGNSLYILRHMNR